jgi:cellulose synthase/poly-beta-1,6-N-acetylglucosamine synthase-like glycosyltransferase
MIASAVRRWCAKPGALYTTVCLVFVSLQSLNVIGYLYARELSALALPRSTQLLWLTIGPALMFCALQILCTFVWSLLIKPPPLPPPYAADRADLPFVTVQIPLRNEELDVVARYSLASAFALHYPPDRLEIQVIDNSDTPERYLPIQRYLNAEAARRRVSAVFLHREGTAGFKARNLNLGLAAARGTFFLILDADSAVSPDTLLSVLPYFQDPELGYVQLELRAQNENANFVTRGAAMQCRSRALQMRVKDSQGYVAFEGHNGIIRRQALEAANGWSEELSEDLATSIRMRLAGFRGRWAPLATGELMPDRLPEMMKQRWRWTLGTNRILWRESGRILASPRLRWFEKLDLMLFLASLSIEGLGILFVYAPYSPTAVLFLLALAFLPTLITERFTFRRALVRHLAAIVVISAVLPTACQATLHSFLRRPHRFAVTAKGAFKPLSLVDLLRVHAFGLSAAVLFFAFVVLWTGNPAHLLTRFLGGTILMSSALIAPFLLNYSERLLGLLRTRATSPH